MPESAQHAAGGLWVGLLNRVHLDDSTPRGLRRRVAAVVLVAWLPLLLLTAASGQLAGGVDVPFVRDLEAHVRMLVVIPLLLVAEVEARAFLPMVVQEFVRRDLIPAGDLPRYESAIEAGRRLRNSARAEAVLVVLVYAVFIGVVWRQYGSIYASTWYSTRSAAGNDLSPAGWWYVMVSLPLVQFLILRWYLWILTWARFLWQASRIPLRLVPTHPDRAGGLGFLEGSGYIFMLVAVAHGAIAAGPIASLIFFKGAALPEFVDELAMVVAWVILMIYGPALFFSAQLIAAKKTGLFAFGRLAQRYVREFDARWLANSAPPENEPLMGSADIQSLADLGNAYTNVEGLRLFPMSYVAMLRLGAITLLPVAPLLLTMVPLDKLLIGVFSIVL
jgi:hypothetical protein